MLIEGQQLPEVEGVDFITEEQLKAGPISWEHFVGNQWFRYSFSPNLLCGFASSQGIHLSEEIAH
jgi:hypothetical protein